MDDFLLVRIFSCIYSSPEIAVVGLTEAEAKEQGVAAVAGKCIMFRNARTMIEDPGRCFMKIVADKASHEILGAQFMCQHASDMISQISEAMVNHLTAEQMLRTMRPETRKPYRGKLFLSMRGTFPRIKRPKGRKPEPPPSRAKIKTF